MNARTVVYAIAALILLYIFVKGRKSQRVSDAISSAAAGFRKLWTPLIGGEQ